MLQSGNCAKKALKKKLYKRFKVLWMLWHDENLESFLSSFLDYVSDNEITLGDLAVSWRDDMEEWEKNRGFEGLCYPCFNEFLDTEFLDEKCMEQLFQCSDEQKLYQEIIMEQNPIS